MSEPITVTIKDLTGTGRSLSWLAKGPQWLPANGEVTIDYEPWSCANNTQRISIVAELKWRRILLILHIKRAGGATTDIAYDPSCSSDPVAEATQAVSATAKAESAKTPEPADKPFDGADHIILAGDRNMSEMSDMFTATIVKPKESVYVKEANIGFTDVPIENPGDKAVVAETLDKVAEEEAPIEATPDRRAIFATYVAEKRWQDALQLLIDEFGEDKVTFSTRVIMSMKDWDAIVAKYKLGE